MAAGRLLRNGLAELLAGAAAIFTGGAAAAAGAGIGPVRLLVGGGLLLVSLGAGRLAWYRLYG